MDPVLEVQSLVKTFYLSKKQQKLQNIAATHITALAGVDFNVYPGQIYGLLGPNGAGKTTALRIIATLIKPDSGDAKVFGKSVRTEPEFVRGKIGFLTSELKLEDFFSPATYSIFLGASPSAFRYRQAKENSFVHPFRHQRFCRSQSGQPIDGHAAKGFFSHFARARSRFHHL
jgi:ABC-type multidrug transport system ATPase subunit